MRISATKAQGVDTDKLLPSLRPIHWLYRNGESALFPRDTRIGLIGLDDGRVNAIFQAHHCLDKRCEAGSIS